jgi:release factor glutamine methyltransferase
MFVKNNSLAAVLDYFRNGLADRFTEREIRSISRALVCERMNWMEMDFITNSNATFSESDLLFFRSKLKALQNNEPFQYVLGKTFFYNLTLKTDNRALIPRPETEELVHLIVTENKNTQQVLLDIGTGTGCIPLAIKKAQPHWEVYGLDQDEEALALAKENKDSNGLAVHFLQLDILDESTWKQFDKELSIIVSNPPYIPFSERSRMAQHVVDFEPEIALFVHDHDPLIFYKKIVKFAKTKLSEKGMLYLEIHEDLASEVTVLLEAENWSAIKVHRDLQGKNRMVTATM